jgi:hypothetical protein
VGFRGLHADSQLRRNLLVAPALGEQLNNDPLAAS